MKLPESIRIAGYDVDIIQPTPREMAKNLRYGYFDADELTIAIDSSQTPVRLADVLIHEIMHAVSFFYNVYPEDDEERTVRTSATGFMQVLRDNPELYLYLGELLGFLNVNKELSEDDEQEAEAEAEEEDK